MALQLRLTDVGFAYRMRQIRKFFSSVSQSTTTKNQPGMKITNIMFSASSLKSMNSDKSPFDKNVVERGLQKLEIRSIVNNNINERVYQPRCHVRSYKPSRELSIPRARVTRVYYSLTCQLTLVSRCPTPVSPLPGYVS